MKLHVFLLAALALLDPSCKGRRDSSQALQNKESNLPVKGISAFDALRQNKTPATFRELVDLIKTEAKGTAMHGFIPDGRSLTRHAADYHSPRIVVLINHDIPFGIGPSAGREKDGEAIFMGYNAALNSAEVISYNRIEGQFDFQIVTNLGVQGEAPEVFYPPRERCVVCHRTEAPIFSRQRWSEVADHNSTILRTLRNTLPSKQGEQRMFYEGFEVYNSADDNFEHEPPPGFQLENASSLTTMRLAANDIWANICKGDGQCRADLLRMIFGRVLGVYDKSVIATEPYKTSRDRFVAKLTAIKGDASYQWQSHILPDRDPTTEPTITPVKDPATSELSTTIIKDNPTYKHEMYFEDIPDLIGQAFTANDVVRLRQNLVGKVRSSDEKLVATLERVAADWKNETWATTDGPLDRCVVLKSLVGEPTVEGCEPFQAAWRAPVLSTTGPVPKELEPFSTYCGACHGKDGARPTFLAGKDQEEIRIAFLAWSRCLTSALGERMPPRDQIPRFTKPFTADTRKHLLVLARTSELERQLTEKTPNPIRAETCPR